MSVVIDAQKQHMGKVITTMSEGCPRAATRVATRRASIPAAATTRAGSPREPSLSGRAEACRQERRSVSGGHSFGDVSRVFFLDS